MKIKDIWCFLIGAIGGIITHIFGGWDTSLAALVLFMTIDFGSGLVVAGYFKKSGKTESGALESNVCFKGLCKKCMILAFVAIGYWLDKTIGTAYIRDAVCIGFIANELISIIENAGIMGVPIPKTIERAIEILKSKEDK